MFARIIAVCAVLAISATGAAPANATYIALTSPSQFTGRQTLITFDEGDFSGHVPFAGEQVSSYRNIGFQSIGGLSDMPQAGDDPLTVRQFGPGGDAGKTVLNDLSFYSQGQGEGLRITLPGLTNQFGAEFLAVTAGDFTFTLFNGIQQVDLFNITAGQIGQEYYFHAFRDSSAFDRVLIRGPGANDGRVIFDNMRFVVPEPNILALLSIGMLILFLGRRPNQWQRRRD